MSVLAKMNEIAFAVLPHLEPKLDDCPQNMPLGLSLEQDVEVCIVMVPKQVLKSPKEDKYFLGQLGSKLRNPSDLRSGEVFGIDLGFQRGLGFW